jgi:hypothetical protein
MLNFVVGSQHAPHSGVLGPEHVLILIMPTIELVVGWGNALRQQMSIALE